MKTRAAAQFTGRHMLALMVAFFGVIVAVNVTMAVYANTSWSGFVVRNSYVAGLDFNRKAEEHRRQAALGWTSALAIADGRLRFELADADGRAVALAGGVAAFRRPVGDAEDARIALAPASGTGLEAAFGLRDGVWIVEIEAETGRAAPWRETRRVNVRNGAVE